MGKSLIYVTCILLYIQFALQELCFYRNLKNHVYCYQGQTTVSQGFTYFKLLFFTKLGEFGALFLQMFFSTSFSLSFPLNSN